jgi:hypothetical protein
MIQMFGGPDDDMVTDLFRPFEDDLSQHFQDDFRSFLGSCDAILLRMRTCSMRIPSHIRPQF